RTLVIMLSRCVPLVSRPNGVSSPSEDLRLIFQDDRRIFNQQNLHDYPFAYGCIFIRLEGEEVCHKRPRPILLSRGSVNCCKIPITLRRVCLRCWDGSSWAW